jgi:hypothetical protein
MKTWNNENDCRFSLVDRTAYTGIFASCRLIHLEASEIVQQKVREIMEEPLKIPIDAESSVACDMGPI